MEHPYIKESVLSNSSEASCSLAPSLAFAEAKRNFSLEGEVQLPHWSTLVLAGKLSYPSFHYGGW